MIKSTLLLSGLSFLGLPFFLLAAQGSSAQAPAPASGGAAPVLVHNPYVMLQSTTSGPTQNGHVRVSGTIFSGQVDSNTVQAITSSGTAVFGQGSLNGVEGHSTGAGASGVYGQNFNSSVTGGFGVAGRGRTGVLGDGGFSGTGMLALGDTGLRAEGVSWAITTSGSASVTGDLWVSGAKVGYVADVVRNVDVVPLEPGMLVEIVGAEEALLGDIPVIAVRRASSADPRAVLGPIAHAIVAEREVREKPVLPGGDAGMALARREERQLLRRSEGAIMPGTFGNVVTLGSFRALRVDASYGAIQPGDLLVASPNPGHAMVDNDARTGTVVGKALAAWSGGAGEIPVMVSSR